MTVCSINLPTQHTMRMQLTEVRIVALRLALNVSSVPAIIVAGTNGKGSTIAALNAIYCASGYKVGCYTSPHLLQVNERICISSKPITDIDLQTIITIIHGACDTIKLTYFEILTLAALYYFKQHAVEVILLEVGLGGRLDATNIIDADLAILTTIDLDHTAYLGTTREAIGREKAGVLRKHQYVIYADSDMPNSIAAIAEQHQAKLIRYGIDYSLHITTDHLIIEFLSKQIQLPIPRIHPAAAVSAIIATDCLQAQLPVQYQAYVQAMQTVFLPGRQQVVEGIIKIVYDVSHNAQSVQLLSNFMCDVITPTATVHAIFSCLQDKDIYSLIRPMQQHVHKWYPTYLSGERATATAVLSTVLQDVTGVNHICHTDPVTAYCAALTQTKPGDIILVYGSFLTVSAIMAWRGDKDEISTR